MPAINKLKKHLPKLVSITLAVVALCFAYVLYVRYTNRPWTRDGQVRANVVELAPRVGGYLVQVAVKDNQSVQAGQLLFQVDPSSYQLAVDQAQVSLDQARQEVAALEAAVRAAEASVKQQNAEANTAESQIVEAKSGLESATASIKEAQAGVVSARAQIQQAKAQLAEAEREAARAQKLADSKAGSVEDAESKAAAAQGAKAQVDSANAGLDQAEATLDKAKAGLNKAQAQLVIAQNGLVQAQAAVASAVADLDQAKANLGEPGEANVKIRIAKVQLEQAKLNLTWTTIDAPADGYVTNMHLVEGTFVSPGTPFALFVDSSSYRVDAYFQETKLNHIKPGDQAIVTLMGHQQRRLEGEIESIGYAINPPDLAQTDGPNNLIPTIQPSFDWIRLAQRVPVRVRFAKIPDDLHLVSGTTASVSIQK